jgi:hypothetical protein
MMRYFRCDAGDAAYEQIRSTLDAAWGLPDAATKTVTCIDPAAVAPRDAQGRIVLAVQPEFCEFTVAVDLLPQLLASGVVAEITAAEYTACFPSPYV